MEMNKLLDEYGRYTFNDETMKERIPKSTYKAFHEALDKGEPLSKEVATVIANAMKIWAVENGATPILAPELEPWGQRTCYIADPEGNLIEIGSWNKPYAEKDL